MSFPEQTDDSPFANDIDWIPQLDKTPEPTGHHAYKWIYHYPTKRLHFEDVTGRDWHHDDIRAENYGEAERYNHEDSAKGYADVWPDSRGKPVLDYQWYDLQRKKVPDWAKADVVDRLTKLHPDALDKAQDSPYKALTGSVEASEPESDLPAHLGGTRGREAYSGLWDTPELVERDQSTRIPWLIDASTQLNPNPVMWLGKPGEYHIAPNIFKRENKIGMSSDVMRGTLRTDTEPPTFHSYRGGPQAEWAKAHILRAYHQGVNPPKLGAVQRLFVAFDIDPQTAQSVRQLQAQLITAHPELRPENDPHITIAFLGDTDDTLVPALAQQIRLLRGQLTLPTFTVQAYEELDKLSWLRLSDDGNGQAWYNALSEWLTQSMGWKPQFPNFIAHITLFRYDRPLGITEADEIFLGRQVPTQDVGVYSSARGTGYTRVGHGDGQTHVFHPDQRLLEDGGRAVDHEVDMPSGDGNWLHRTPYVYDKTNDLIHWGNAGDWHTDLQRPMLDWYAKNGIEYPARSERVHGAVAPFKSMFSDIFEKGQIGHAIRDEMIPYNTYDQFGNVSGHDPNYDKHRARLEQLVGYPIQSNMNPDSMMNYVGEPTNDWSNPVLGASPKDWKTKYDYKPREKGKSGCGACAAWKAGANAEGNGLGQCMMFKAQAKANYTCSEWTDEWHKESSQHEHSKPIKHYDASIPPAGGHWNQRTPYVYDTRTGMAHQGQPGWFHGDLTRLLEPWYQENTDMMPPHWDERVEGILEDMPDGTKRHRVRAPELADEHLSRLEHIMGLPVSRDFEPLDDSEDPNNPNKLWTPSPFSDEDWGAPKLASSSLTFKFERVNNGVPSGELWPQINAYSDGQQVGYLSWNFGEGEGETIHDVWVAPAYRRQGVATAMMDAVTKEIGHRLLHSDDLTDDAQGWREAVGSSDLLADSADSWTGPQSVDKFEVGMPSAPELRSPCWCEYGTSGTIPHEWGPTCENSLHPTLPEQAHTAAEQVPGNEGHWDSPIPTSDGVDTSPNRTNSWVWLDGKVGFGSDHHNIVEQLARELGWPEDRIKYVSNLLARNHLPHDLAVATGELKGDYPHIWMSTRDRNRIWDDVARARDTRHTAGITEDMWDKPELIRNGPVFDASVPVVLYTDGELGIGKPGGYHQDIRDMRRYPEMYARVWPEEGLYNTYYGGVNNPPGPQTRDIGIKLQEEYGRPFNLTRDPMYHVGAVDGMQITHETVNMPSGTYEWISANVGGKLVGQLLVRPTDGKILNVRVEQEYRRMGVASDLFEYAKSIGLNPQHDDGPGGLMSPAAQQWAPTVTPTMAVPGALA